MILVYLGLAIMGAFLAGKGAVEMGGTFDGDGLKLVVIGLLIYTVGRMYMVYAI